MWDPTSWSLSCGRLFGVNIRVHVLFPIVAFGLILRAAYTKGAPNGTWIDAAMLVGLLFVIVLLHEFGHVLGARLMDGDADQVLIWPLGGLASVEVPQTPRANFVTTAAGPLANLLICLVVGLGFCYLTDFKLQPPWNPLPGGDWGWSPYRCDNEGHLLLYNWSHMPVEESRLAVIVLARMFWLSLVLLALNTLFPGFPLDGGRMFQCALWPRLGFRASMQWAIYAGFLTAIAVGIASIAMNDALILFLALFIFYCCRQQLILMDSNEDSVFGYDFSQGYTSLEREEGSGVQPRRRQSMLQRWRQNRLARKAQREQELREADERRMDELLEKVQREGLQALTDEERRFLKRVSDKYRNRH
ncbi:MAG TPA: site-2 protease family protein [Gemmataceae bacterium]|nr:site-2 protease family protein [Gemmataceae bacterium]